MEMELFVDKDYTTEATVLYVNQVIYVQTSVDYNSTIQERVVNFLEDFIQDKTERELQILRYWFLFTSSGGTYRGIPTSCWYLS